MWGEKFGVKEALILAAGKGERLGELTQNTPKALVPIAGVPLLHRILRLLKETGVTEAHVVVGYKGNRIREKIGENFEGLRVRYIENSNWEKGNLYSLLAAKEYVKNDFLLLMSDHIFDARVVEHLANHEAKQSLTLVVDRREPIPGDTKVLETDGKIVNIGKNIEVSNCVDTGLFLCSTGVFRHAEAAAKEGNGELADCVRFAAADGDAGVFDVTEIPSYVAKMRRNVGFVWHDIDTKEDLREAKWMLVQSSGKGASDFLAHYVHAPLENKIVYYISDSRVTPNQLTVITNIVAYGATLLFFFGHLLVASLLTFAVGIMDGLDGKLARVRGQVSKLGTMEHPFDMLFEFSWFVALALFLFASTQSSLPLILCIFIIVSVAFYRQVYDRFGRTMGKSLDDYGSFERKFRRVAGRRNLYNIHILGWVLVGAPLLALVTILCHAVLTAAVYALRAGLYMHAVDKGAPPA